MKKKCLQYFSKVIMIIYLSATIVSCSNGQAQQQNSANTNWIRIALLLDTSNSMDGLIDQAKSQLWKIVNELATAKKDGQMAQIQIALYEYGNSGLSITNGYIRQVSPLTSDLDEISSKLFALKTNGGDEYCGKVIAQATDELDWSQEMEDLQYIFIAGNEPFTQGSTDYVEACIGAKNKNIVVNTIFCGSRSEGIRGSWQKGAQIANGSYMSIDSDKKTAYIATPYDDQINQINIKLNGTFFGYGTIGKSKKSMQLSEDANASSVSKANSVERIKFKNNSNYKRSAQKWDIVSKYEMDEAFEIETVEEEMLPEPMKNMNKEEKTQFLEEKKQERKRINTELDSLMQLRDSYVAKEKIKSIGADKDMLDAAMLKAIKEIAESKNYIF